MKLLPIVLWAQKKECIYLTIDLEGAENVKIDLKEDKLSFYGMKGVNEYEFELLFFKPINVEESKYGTKRNIKFKIIKQEKERWKTLNKDGKKHWIKCDWDAWVDTDEENKVTDFDDMAMNNFGNMPDMSQFGGLGGMGGMGGMGDLDFSKLGGMGNGDLPNFSGMDNFKNLPDMANMNDDDSSSYSDSDDSDSEDSDDEAQETAGDSGIKKGPKKSSKNDSAEDKNNVENEATPVNEPSVEA